jgi:GDP-mannose transporter
MYYNNVLTLPILILCTLFLESWNGPNLAVNFPASSRSTQFIAMIYSGLATIFISYASAWCIRITSSTTYSMVGALNKLPIAMSGLLIFEKEITKGGVLAILMGFGSGLVYAFAKKRESGAARRSGKERDLERLEEEDGFERAILLPSRRPSLKLGKVHE